VVTADLLPATPGEVAEALRCADGPPVLPCGAGTKLHWGGAPAGPHRRLDLGGLRGVVAHEPGDLVATVRAGTPLREFQAVLARAGQRLPIEAGSADATVGGVLAAGESGPLRLRHGTGRDLLIGVEFVRADGVLARSGGRVVKNVAGYDVGKLLCGSYGTLAVITSATFRLHPVPAGQVWVLAPVDADVTEPVRRLLTSTLAPSAVELDLPGPTGWLAVLLEGSVAGVAERARQAVRLLGADAVIAEAAPAWWGAYPFGPADVALRLAVGVAGLPRAISALRSAAHQAGLDGVAVRGWAGLGVVHARLDGAPRAEQVGAVLTETRAAVDGSMVVLCAPAPLREALDLWGPVPGLGLMRRLKAQFDPAGRFVAGRFVGGL
jgi:glycolate oxidase FAD binding subunit